MEKDHLVEEIKYNKAAALEASTAEVSQYALE